MEIRVFQEGRLNGWTMVDTFLAVGILRVYAIEAEENVALVLVVTKLLLNCCESRSMLTKADASENFIAPSHTLQRRC